MDRLSTYANRDTEAESADERMKAEEEATSRLLEKLRISKEAKAEPAKEPAEPSTSDRAEEPETKAEAKEDTNGTTSAPPEAAETNGEVPKGSIPPEIKLYEIFYEQVVNLVSAQRLPIQDTTALLVSLVKLAL